MAFEWTYMAVCTLLTLLLVKKSGSSHKFILFLIIWWLWSQTYPARDHMYVTVTPGFDLQPPRVLLLIFIFFTVKEFFLKGRMKFLKGSSYEKYLLGFYVVALISVLHHMGRLITPREAVVLYSGWLFLPAFYIVLRRTADQGMVVGILRAFIGLGILSSIVAIIQFFVLPDFLRYEFHRLAFGSHLRSNGLFREEYVHSYFCIIASYATLFFVESRFRKTVILGVLAIGVFLSFHRMSYFVFGITFMIGFLFLLKDFSFASKSILVVGTIAFLTFMIGVSSQTLEHTKFVTQRLDSPIAERIAFYKVAAERIKTDWLFGVGSRNTRAYYVDAVASGHAYAATEMKGGIHNLYLYLGYFYGLPVTLAFIAFLVAAFRFYWDQFRNRHMFYLLASLTMLNFILANLTNWFQPNEDVALYMAIIIGFSASVWEKGLEERISL